MIGFKGKETILDDEVTLLKPLGYNFITFYLRKLNKIVIFHLQYQIIVKSFEVHNILQYEFSMDKRYFYTYEKDIIRIYQLQDEQCFLNNEIQRDALMPISFQQNFILCLKCYNPDLSFDDLSDLDRFEDDNYSQENEDQLRSYERISYQEIHIIDLQVISLQCQMHNQFITFKTLNNFYLLIYEFGDIYMYYQVMRKNKRLIKYFFGRDYINDAQQLKYSNLYLTRIEEQLLIMIKQQLNCKRIRKIQIYKKNSLKLIKYNPVYNNSQVIYVLDINKKHYLQIINLWDLNKERYMIDSFKDIVWTDNTKYIVTSEGRCLKIRKMY